MIYVLSNSFNPFFNLATEEYLLKNSDDDIFMLWRSEPSVIVGKHQNAPAEINLRYCRENNLHIARRLSGGGTVVHDLNNLNFTFIRTGEAGKLIDFKRFVNPVIDYLKTLGIEAHIGKTNDIRIGELKVSGNAEHVYRNRTLHHGTLLYNSDLSQLRQAIKVLPGKYTDKAVQSNRASVTNIADFLNEKPDIDSFTNQLGDYICMSNNATRYQLNKFENNEINKLATDKFMTWEWVWGYSPRFLLSNATTINNTKIRVELKVEKGIITESEIFTDKEFNLNISSLCGLRHSFDEIKSCLMNQELPNILSDKIDDMVYLFF